LKNFSIESSPSESFYHKAIKNLIFNSIYDKTNVIAVRKLEKYIGNRFADVYFKLKSGEGIAVEIQNSNITVKEIIQRTKDYNNLGIYVLWILHGEGNCVASKKFPLNAKQQKVSPAESYLHKMYGGRVYYINLDINQEEVTLKRPFALHFSNVMKKKKRRIFHSRYTTFFYRDINFTFIPSWNLLCTKFLGYKIARFYDKNIKYALKEKIEEFIVRNNLHLIAKKKQLKYILIKFSDIYGEFMILSVLIDIINEKKLNISHKLFRKIKRKVIDRKK